MYGERDEHRRQQQLVRDRIEHGAEFALPAEALGEKAVGRVRQRGDAEQERWWSRADDAASATAMGTTSRILIELMTFGMWRADQDTRLTTQLEALNPILAGGDRLQTPVQRERALQRIGAAARRQAKSNGIAGQAPPRSRAR